MTFFDDAGSFLDSTSGLLDSLSSFKDSASKLTGGGVSVPRPSIVYAPPPASSGGASQGTAIFAVGAIVLVLVLLR